MITKGTGNLLTADVDAVVNTVNTVGVMGKGIALQVKRAFPDAYAAYRAACDRGEVQIGRMHVHDRGVLGSGRYIINFPTKRHWKSRSRLEDIDAGLVDLRRVVRDLGVASVAVPALGCGNGGLDWAEVRPRIEAALSDLPDVTVVLFPPTGAPPAAAMPVGTTRPALTAARALLLAAMASYVDRARVLEPGAEGISELETQKIAYLLQLLGAPLRLTFKPARYGPYAEQLPHVLQILEGHHIVGFGDRSSRVLEFTPITVKSESRAEAETMLDGSTRELVDRLAELTSGLESPYGMELLTTVHLAATTVQPSTDVAEITHRVSQWNPRKARLFTHPHVSVALQRLRSADLLSAAA